MSDEIRCPVCGRTFEGNPLKTWKFRFYEVRRFKCPCCGEKFNLYESPKSTFTIPKAKK